MHTVFENALLFSLEYYAWGPVVHFRMCERGAKRVSGMEVPQFRGTSAAAPPLFRPSDPALCGSHPLGGDVKPCSINQSTHISVD